MRRRRYLTAVGATLCLSSLSGCTGVVPPGSSDDPTYPGGTLVVENTGNESLQIRVTVPNEPESPELETAIEAGETIVQREFVTAQAGEAVTLAARIGDSGDPTSFAFLPTGGTADAPPEVARLTIENAVEESASWAATDGTA